MKTELGHFTDKYPTFTLCVREDATGDIVATQADEGICAWIDIDGTLQPDTFESNGGKVDELYIMQPETKEQGLEVVEALLSSGSMDAINIVEGGKHYLLLRDNETYQGE